MKKVFDSKVQPGELAFRDRYRHAWGEEGETFSLFSVLPEQGDLDVLAVEIASKPYLVDRTTLQETIFVSRKSLQVFPSDEENIFLSQLRGRPLPVLYLGDLLELNAELPESGSLLIWKSRRELLAVMVDKLLEPKTIDLSKIDRSSSAGQGIVGSLEDGESLVDLRILELQEIC